MSESAPQYEASVERLTDIQRKLAVEIPWDEVKGRLDEAYSELGKGVTIKGFRKGKVPRKMLEQIFGKHVNKEVAQRLVQESIPKALTDDELAAGLRAQGRSMTGSPTARHSSTRPCCRWCRRWSPRTTSAPRSTASARKVTRRGRWSRPWRPSSGEHDRVQGHRGP